HPDHRVELVDGPVGLDPRVRLAPLLAADQPARAAVARSGVDLRDPHRFAPDPFLRCCPPLASLGLASNSGGIVNRRVRVLPMRGSDSTLLEVQLPDLLRRPLGQIAAVNVMDLVALSEATGVPKSLERGLAGFVEGLGRRLADIPKGRSWD